MRVWRRLGRLAIVDYKPNYDFNPAFFFIYLHIRLGLFISLLGTDDEGGNKSPDFLGTIVILNLILFLKCSYIEIIFIFK